MKILIHGKGFPVAMWRFFDWAFRDLGHEVFSVGNYSGDTIPWGPDFHYPKYAFPPDHIIPEMDYPVTQLLKEIDFKPDVIIQAADVISLTGKAPCKNVLLKTDPHAVDYSARELNVDHVFNMQHFYMKPGETWVPYAFYPHIHKRLSTNGPKKYDVVFSGLQYDHRKQALDKMSESGLNVLNVLGLVYEDYVETYNQGKIAFVYSSKQDLPARFWEGLAMGNLVLVNKVPDLDMIGDLTAGTDYVTFETIEEAVEKAQFYSKNFDERMKIANKGWEKVQPHNYYWRAKVMLERIEAL